MLVLYCLRKPRRSQKWSSLWGQVRVSMWLKVTFSLVSLKTNSFIQYGLHDYILWKILKSLLYSTLLLFQNTLGLSAMAFKYSGLEDWQTLVRSLLLQLLIGPVVCQRPKAAQGWPKGQHICLASPNGPTVWIMKPWAGLKTAAQ